jgi:tetratricopeptide (TPR) repeat protein
MRHTSADLAAKINNQADAQINDGQYAEACHTLAHALKLVERALETCPLQKVAPLSRQLVEVYSSFDECTKRMHSSCVNEESGCVLADADATSSQHDDYHPLWSVKDNHSQFPHTVFREPIRIEMLPSQEELRRFTTSDWCMIQVTIIYNFALVHHLCSFQNGIRKECRRNLRAASMALYDVVLIMQHECNLELSALYSLASLNNLANVHTLLGDEFKAGECLKALLAHLMLLADSLGNISFLSEFFSSVAHLIISDPKTAAAA